MGLAGSRAFVSAAALRLARPFAQAATQSGGSASGRGAAASTSISPRACLQGNFRLGQVHFEAGPDRSATVR
ncbi:hypothetical protein MET9862_05439 [Methylobacterium symbioticum]|uniref:Uncharacterized protein n=1 Tax=Methylobacterium symbioticum TaxID=2584084 RepID=A0A509EK77_9HYPH|nr:hypothetical protein MET9862_05439 [Methylobacterium symbioticum]